MSRVVNAIARPSSSCLQNTVQSNTTASSFQLYTKSHIPRIFARYAPHLDASQYRAAAEVFPMRVNRYVTDTLIDWSRVPDDPIFRLVFPQPEMLGPNELRSVAEALGDASTKKVGVRGLVEAIRRDLNPHPSGQKEENVPQLNGQKVPGIQHKYRETVLFFPTEGQFCHSFCTYCFRWAQFTAVGSDQQFQSKDIRTLIEYLKAHKQVKDVLFTGGDPMVMPAKLLRKYISALLDAPGLEHLSSIRVGSKSLAFWPYRYTTDKDAKEVLDIFGAVTKSGRHMALQAHFSHPRELESPAVQEAIRLIRMTGAQIRCQSPLIRRVNDSAKTWQDMWNEQVRLGLIPYYMFVERDTGASSYFSVPLSRAYTIFSNAYSGLGGLARTVRGPSMSASPGKISVVGIDSIAGQKVFIMKFLQARDPAWIGTTFLAKFDEHATWLDELVPAFGDSKFFYEEEYQKILDRVEEGSSGQLAR